VRLETLGSTFWTIPEVLAEVREKQARAKMAVMPYTIETRVPSEESMKVATSQLYLPSSSLTLLQSFKKTCA